MTLFDILASSTPKPKNVIVKIKSLLNKGLNSLSYYDDTEINSSISNDIEEAYYLFDDLRNEIYDLRDSNEFLEDNLNVILTIFDEACKHFGKIVCVVHNYDEISAWLKTQKFNYYESLLNSVTIRDTGIVVIDRNGFMMLKLHFAQHIIGIKKEI